MNRCIFLDRDGVINVERGEYTYIVEDFVIESGVVEMLSKLKKRGFLLIIITNQGGINKGLYGVDDVMKCHQFFQDNSNKIIDDFFYSPYHDDFTKSLSRKPNSLMLERAIYKWDIDVENSWMIGDGDRDMFAAKKVGVFPLFVQNNKHKYTELSFESPAEALKYVDEITS